MNEVPVFSQLRDSLICPDCSGRVRPETIDEFPLLKCQSCSRILDWNNGVLMGLPREMSNNQVANSDFYDVMSKDEENHLGRRAQSRTHQIKFAAIKEALGLNSAAMKGNFLEIGTGYGSLGNSIGEGGLGYVGIDISQGLLEKARNRYESLNSSLLIAADATRLPFQEGVLDGCFCVATLHHLTKPADGAAEMIRVLKPGGKFCFVEPMRFYPTNLAAWLLHRNVEVGVMATTRKAMTEAAKRAGAGEIRVGQCVYTPNKPGVLLPLYDVMDRFMSSIPMLRNTSVMFYVYGVK